MEKGRKKKLMFLRRQNGAEAAAGLEIEFNGLKDDESEGDDDGGGGGGRVGAGREG